MAGTLTDFIQKYLTVLGLTGDDVEAYTNTILITAMGKALLALDLSDAEKETLERELQQAKDNPDSAVGALDRALPDGRQNELFGAMVADSLNDSIDESTAMKLAALVDDFVG